MSSMVDIQTLYKNLRNLSLSEEFEPPIERSFQSPQRRHSFAPDFHEEPCWTARDSLSLETSRTPFRPDRSISLIEGSRSALPPPPGFPPLKTALPPLPAPSSRYKTELCRTFSETGTCKYGSKCQFAHGSMELREPNRHPKYKTELCHKFYLYGECPYGSRCNFIHHPSEHGAPQQVLRQSFSYSGVPARRRSPTPPGFPDPASFSRAPSVSPPPSELFFSPAPPETRSHVSSLKSSDSCSRCCSCRCSRAGNVTQDPFSDYMLLRSPSSTSLPETECYSSGSESPVFEISGQLPPPSNKRLPIFNRLSVSD
ncbi:mRNA decay activator protein ZFP36-like [Spea bombifrons]|uniref:mRNA decay activator protein ZFP36-like n=1 Tax=Spea bombifrons TaxID=233779 RepID=UPI00234A5929|nr:mRNA decay activator protein ZFP36-like [Spea bombifrons]